MQYLSLVSFPVDMIKHPNKTNLGEKLCDSQFQFLVHHCGEVKVAADHTISSLEQRTMDQHACSTQVIHSWSLDLLPSGCFYPHGGLGPPTELS